MVRPPPNEMPPELVVRVSPPPPVALTAPVTLSAWLLVRAKPPPPVLAKAPRPVIKLPVPPKVEPPTDAPVSVPAVRTFDALWVIVPVATRLTAPEPPSLNAPLATRTILPDPSSRAPVAAAAPDTSISAELAASRSALRAPGELAPFVSTAAVTVELLAPRMPLAVTVPLMKTPPSARNQMFPAVVLVVRNTPLTAPPASTLIALPAETRLMTRSFMPLKWKFSVPVLPTVNEVQSIRVRADVRVTSAVRVFPDGFVVA